MTNWWEILNEYGKRNFPCFFMVDFLGENGKVWSLNQLLDQNIWLNFPKYANFQHENLEQEIRLKVFPIGKEVYKKAFDLVQFHLNRGDSYLTNLTFATPIETNATLSQIFLKANAKYKIKFQDEWLCFSPETFVKIEGNTIQTFPMKGTIDAALPNAAESLLKNEKETAEHHTIVDLLRNDLSQVAKNVKVERLKYLDEIKTQNGSILQMSSEISGDLPPNWKEKMGDILKLMLPAGSISGAPKDKTLQIIQLAENYERGFYTGIAGYFDGENLDTCVLIRFIEKSKEGLVYKSGGGITTQSQLADEFIELQQKVYVPIS